MQNIEGINPIIPTKRQLFKIVILLLVLKISENSYYVNKTKQAVPDFLSRVHFHS